MIQDFFTYTLRSMKRRRLRTGLTMLGIVIGIATIVAMISIGQGMKNAIEENFQKLGIKNIRIVNSALRGPPSEGIGMDKSVVDIVEKVKGVDYVDPVLIHFGNVEYNNKEQFMRVFAAETDIAGRGFVDLDIDPIEGRVFLPQDIDAALLGYGVAKENEDLFDKAIRVKNSLTINGKKFKVIGIFEKTGTPVDDNIYIPMKTGRELFNEPNLVNVVTAAVLPGEDINDVAEEIKKKLDDKLGEDAVTVFTPEQLVRQIQSILNVVQIVLAGIAAISLLVGGVGIMNSMYTSVYERTRDIGIMKAIGAKNSHVLTIFLIEAGFLGLVGGIIGVVIGTIMAKLVGLVASIFEFGLLSIHVNFVLIIQALILSIIIGVVSGLLPVLKAAKLKPVEALRYE